MEDDKVFFEKLLDLCREHKVNIEGAEVRIGDISFPPCLPVRKCYWTMGN